MKVQKFRWSKVYESAEEELLDFLQAKNVVAKRQEAEAFSEFSGQTTQPSTLWCAEGSYGLSVGSQHLSIQPGDAIRIPAQAEYKITAGLTGCVWYTG